MTTSALLVAALLSGAPGASATAAPAGKVPRLAVMPLVGASVPAETRALLGGLLAAAVAQRGLHDVLDPEEVAAALAAPDGSEQPACASVECVFDVARATDCPLALFSRLGQVGDEWFVELRLVDSGAQRVLDRAHVSVGQDASRLDDGVREATAALLDARPAPLPTPELQHAALHAPNAGSGATLKVDATVDGASVFLDGRLVGTTPAVISVDPGAHDLAVEKPGHTAYNERLSLTPGAHKSRTVIIKNFEVERSARSNRILMGSLMTAFSIVGVAAGILMMRSGMRGLEDGNTTGDAALIAMGQLLGGEWIVIYGTIGIAGGIALLVTMPPLGAEPTHLGGPREAMAPDNDSPSAGGVLQLQFRF